MKGYLGIDFGTTNSAAMYESVAGTASWSSPTNSILSSPYPSLVFVSNSGSLSFGHDPLNQDYKDGVLVRRLKVLLGAGENVPGIGRRSTDLAKSYLSGLLAFLPINENDKPEVRVVLSVPIRFSDGYREKLRQCMIQLGFNRNNIGFIYEPIAAVYRVLYNTKGKIESNIAVIDWGGGTVDVSIISYKKSDGFISITELNTEGAKAGLGGADMDEWIANKAGNKDAIENLGKIRITEPGRYAQILEAIETFKVRVLNNPDRVNQPRDIPLDGDLCLTITQQLVKECLTFFADGIKKVIMIAIDGAGLGPEDIAGKLMIGGPFISEFVRNNPHFQISPVTNEIANWDETPFWRQYATTAGCALLAKNDFTTSMACDFGLLYSVRNNQNLALDLHPFITNGEIFPKGDVIYNARCTKLQVLEIANPKAVMTVGRGNSGKGVEEGKICVGHMEVDVAHEVSPFQHGKSIDQYATYVPYNPLVEAALLDTIELNVTLKGRKAQKGNGQNAISYVEDSCSKTYDGLPVKVVSPCL
jgi:hypothetical protein